MNKLDQAKERLFFAFAVPNKETTVRGVIFLSQAFELTLISGDWKWYNRVKRDIIKKTEIMNMSPIEQEQYFDSYMRRMRMK